MGLGAVTRLLQRLRRGGAEDSTDRQLLAAYTAAYTAGERPEAFEQLVERHGPMVRGVCRRVLGNEADADDAFQAVFLVLARKAATHAWRDSVAGWLYGVAYCIALRARRGNARRRNHEERAAPRQPTTPTDEVDWGEVRAVLDEELMGLPEK